MKTIGMIGGMSWESSIEYYRITNQRVREKLGGLHSAKSVMVSVDFAEIEVLQSSGRWNEATQMMIDAALQVQRGGADFLMICTNTMHRMAEEVRAALQIPLLHIADATAARVQQAGMTKIGLLGTRFTMEEDFYRGRLESLHGLQVLVPDAAGRGLVHRVIYDELVLGQTKPASRAEFTRIISQMQAEGAQGVILGCTEIGLLVKQGDVDLPLFDTTRIHAEAAVDAALGELEL
ncbi:MAG: aspartate/glutamate racemase family protein [Chloroflexi bacterium]|nr:aspartate/glutamate racemase family protein [Chloroflexota bacterium]